MTRVLITGGGGFIGRRLLRALARSGALTDGAGRRRDISEIVVTDLAPPPVADDPGLAVSFRRGDLADGAFVDALAAEGFDSIFHLASLLTLHAEQDPARAFAVNVEGLRRLIDGAGGRAKLVFTSSIAIFGGALPAEVGDDLNPTPTTTYGAHKAINELLIADASRHGRIDGRSLRLPIVLIRPGAPQPAISDRVAAIARGPMEGEDAICPFGPETPLPVASAGNVVAALIRLHDAPAEDLPPKRAFNLPGLTVTPREMVASAGRMGGTGRVSFAPEPEIERITAGWPTRFASAAAGRLGIRADRDFEAVIADYLEHRGV
ncbi:MAG: NAD-dependent epimerase/dehydratase family protein [Pikeienuella sp.]